MVSAAHLKPLDKGDKINEKFQQPWNMHASKNKTSSIQPRDIPTNKVNISLNDHTNSVKVDQIGIALFTLTASINSLSVVLYIKLPAYDYLTMLPH